MFQRKQRRFGRRSNGRSHGHGHRHGQRNSGDIQRLRSNSFSNGQRNNFRNTLSAEKLFEKYNALAKEAMSIGDKTLSENYLQHADHFMRIIEDKNKNQSFNKPQEKQSTDNKQISENNSVNQDQNIKNKE